MILVTLDIVAIPECRLLVWAVRSFGDVRDQLQEYPGIEVTTPHPHLTTLTGEVKQ